MEKEKSIAELITELLEDRNLKDEIPKYHSESIPFWGDGCDDDIFKAHPEAIKSIPYKPRRR